MLTKRIKKLKKLSKLLTETKSDIENQTCPNDNSKENVQDSSIKIASVSKLEYVESDRFADLDISDSLKREIKRVVGFEHLNNIQLRVISQILRGKDMVCCAKTGSGKSLAFLVPITEKFQRLNINKKNGVSILIVVPTNDRAQKIYKLASSLLSDQSKCVGLSIGDSSKKDEQSKLLKDIKILITTPKNLLGHLLNHKGLDFENLHTLVIDSADQILNKGFEDDMNEILSILPAERQTIFFSANNAKEIDQLSNMSTRNPAYVFEVQSEQGSDTFEQGYVLCQPNHKFRLLFTFLKRNQNKKIVVFLSSCASVKFHSDLLKYMNINVLDIHGAQSNQKRINVYTEFCKLQSGVLLCSNVISKALTIPKVDWIVQFDLSSDASEYVQQMKRCLDKCDSNCKSLLLLLPNEQKYLGHLESEKIKLKEYEFPESQLANIQFQVEKLVQTNYFLNASAKEAYKSYLQMYDDHPHKEVFDVNSIDLLKTSKSFGLVTPPRFVIGNTMGIDEDENLYSNKKNRKANAGEHLIKSH